MRNSLELIEKIEQYLLNESSAEDKLQFEASLENNLALKQQFEHHKNIIKVTQRIALRKQIKTAIKQTYFWSKLMKWLVAGTLIIGLVGAVFFSKMDEEIVSAIPLPFEQTDELIIPVQKADSIEIHTIALKSKVDVVSNDYCKSEDEKKVEEITAYNFKGLKTWVVPNEQKFTINPEKGATIEGEQGVLVIVPSYAFLDDDNNTVTETVTLKMIEALTLEDMVLYNLGTTSNGKSLETGGMIHFDFSCKGKNVYVNPERSLYVEVPTDEVKNGMMAFKGEIEDGKLNWVQPKPLKKYLVNIDFNLLDFLPTGFDDTVRTLLPYKGHIKKSDEFTDSLYYSLGANSSLEGDIIPKKFRREGKKRKTKRKRDYPESIAKSDDGEYQVNCGLDPISIMTLKTKPFSKTYIATKEFEARINELHKTSNSFGKKYLQTYLQNLNKDLSEVDAMVSIQMKGRMALTFRKFAKEGLTNVKDANIYQDQLNAYYNRKRKENKDAVVQLEEDLNAINKKELNKLRKEYFQTIASKNKVKNPLSSIFNKLPKRTVARSSAYSFTWSSGGWVNIDCYLHLLSQGSKKVEMEIINPQESMEVYQWLNTIGNLTPLLVSDNKANALFPKKGNSGSHAMKNTFCFAISMKGGKYQWFEKKFNPYNISEIDITLEPRDIADIRSVLKRYDSGNNVLKRIKHLNKMILSKDNLDAKLKQIEEDWLIKRRLIKVAFPCEKNDSAKEIYNKFE
tara:strand:+ start:4785 stop:6992 length:2208 start_codon:yes stop_codon:yes gene_type:complete